MKRLGFFTGAVLAGIGVFLFNQWRQVSDDDRLTTILSDHCIPFVQTGAEPFADLGRPPGVYDAVTLRDTIGDGGARLIYDNRFTAQWGVVSGAGRSSRVCDIQPTHGEGTIAVFAVSETGFLDRYGAILGLVPNVEQIESGPTTLSWQQSGAAPAQGLRAAMVVSPGAVMAVTVVGDLPN